jgi:hypothetical protein
LQGAAAPRGPRPCENRAYARPSSALNHHPALPRLAGRATTKIRIMDIERINAIGNHIADLSERTTALRGYL